MKNSVDILKTQTVRVVEADNPLKLECGKSLGPIDVAYETYGKQDATEDNVILICHALSGNAHVAGLNNAEDRKPGWIKVRLPGREEILTMVISRIAGEDTPLMLLTNLPVENAEDAKRILLYYLRRWECEEAIRFLKSQVHLERIRTFRWFAICRLMLLAALVMIYIGWIAEKHLVLAERLIRFGQPPPNQADFLPYRLLTGMTEALNGCFWLRRDLLEQHL